MPVGEHGTGWGNKGGGCLVGTDAAVRCRFKRFRRVSFPTRAARFLKQKLRLRLSDSETGISVTPRLTTRFGTRGAADLLMEGRPRGCGGHRENFVSSKPVAPSNCSNAQLGCVLPRVRVLADPVGESLPFKVACPVSSDCCCLLNHSATDL